MQAKQSKAKLLATQAKRARTLHRILSRSSAIKLLGQAGPLILWDPSMCNITVILHTSDWSKCQKVQAKPVSLPWLWLQGCTCTRWPEWPRVHLTGQCGMTWSCHTMPYHTIPYPAILQCISQVHTQLDNQSEVFSASHGWSCLACNWLDYPADMPWENKELPEIVQLPSSWLVRLPSNYIIKGDPSKYNGSYLVYKIPNMGNIVWGRKLNFWDSMQGNKTVNN